MTVENTKNKNRYYVQEKNYFWQKGEARHFLCLSQRNFNTFWFDVYRYHTSSTVIISHWKPLNPGGLLAINNKPAGTIPWRKPLSQPSWQPEAEVVKALLVSAAEVATGKVHSEPQVPHSAAGCTREHSRRKSGTWLCNRVFSFVWLHCQHHTYWNTLAAS